MNALENHLEQISLSAAAISDLPFPPPKIFTNALLHHHDITALIRDTEPHERALFTVAPRQPGSFEASTSSARRATTFGIDTNGESARNGLGVYNGPRSTTAVGRVLGADVLHQIRKGGKSDGKDVGDVDVKLLLKGAERLCEVYPIKGARDKIDVLRSRHERLSSSIAYYEARAAKQAAQLDKMNRPKEYNEHETYDDDDDDVIQSSMKVEPVQISRDDIRREEEEMRELEEKKKGLEERVSGMEKDLGGLLR